jgi:AcrR family transcriptional regulator
MYGANVMDRRQRKTREAIFNAFILLLSKKHYNTITVGEIIQVADIGRATFYSHFETKDFLLKDLCAELFDHIFNTEHSNSGNKLNIFNCDMHGSVFLHLFKHIKKNDNNICKLLASTNNELFLTYFKNEVRDLIIKHVDVFKAKKPNLLPQDFWINYITSTFIETLRWWIENGMIQSPELITEYFLVSI